MGMDIMQFRQFWSNYFEPHLYDIEMWQCINALGIKPYKDGDKWCFLYGDNIQEGICGFGDTIKDAAQDFFYNINKGE